MTIVIKTLKYEDICNKRRFRIEPSRRGTKKPIDPEQFRIFAERQKRLPALWRSMGIVSWKKVEKNDIR
jgi:hypothetical protein